MSLHPGSRLVLLALVPWLGCGGDGSSLPELPEVPDCAALRASFQPCGGALAGTWRIEGICPQGAPFPMSPAGYCPDRAGTITPIQTGILSLEEGTMEVFLQDDLEAATFTLPETCLEDGTSCGEVTVLDGWQAECRDRGADCQCEGRRPVTRPDRTSWPVRIEGTEVLVLDDQDAAQDRWSFCVQGTRALVRATWFLSPDRPAVDTLLVLGP
ncbi:hypothetical protein KBD49_15510 [Myxococcota bacterium]|jgi:hypothetical protein|nr:hypothetical protein [Myxococcota bacterium]